jgi:hypothetical protein
MENKDVKVTDQAARQCITAFLEHWGKARIDGPMLAIARYDDAAKLLITIGGLLQAVLAVGYSFMLNYMNPSMNTGLLKGISIGVFISLLISFSFAGAVCWPQPKMLAAKVLLDDNPEHLMQRVDDWCKDITNIMKVKRRLIHTAVIFFLISSLAMIGLLLNLFGSRALPSG